MSRSCITTAGFSVRSLVLSMNSLVCLANQAEFGGRVSVFLHQYSVYRNGCGGLLSEVVVLVGSDTFGE